MKNVIYKIQNLTNKKLYIGSATNFKIRKTNHKNELKRSAHKNGHLQNAFNKYGIDNFIFEIVDRVPYAEELLDREYYWMSKYNFETELYNIDPVPGSNLGYRHTEEAKEKIGDAQRGKRHYMWGKKHSKKTRNKMSESHIRDTQRIQELIERRSKSVIQIDKNTNEAIAFFSSAAQANRETGVTATNISAVCREEKKTAGGYRWRYAKDNDIIDEKHIGKVFIAIPFKKPVAQIDKDTNQIVGIYESGWEAMRKTGIAQSGIYATCNKKSGRKTAGGFKWKYLEDIEEETNQS